MESADSAVTQREVVSRHGASCGRTTLVTQTDAENPDELGAVGLAVSVDVECLGRITERQVIAAAVNIPAAEPSVDLAEREREQPADVEEAELVILAGKFVVVIEAEADFDRHGERHRAFRKRKTWTDAELGIRTFVGAAIGLPIT